MNFIITQEKIKIILRILKQRYKLNSNSEIIGEEKSWKNKNEKMEVMNEIIKKMDSIFKENKLMREEKKEKRDAKRKEMIR